MRATTRVSDIFLNHTCQLFSSSVKCPVNPSTFVSFRQAPWQLFFFSARHPVNLSSILSGTLSTFVFVCQAPCRLFFFSCRNPVNFSLLLCQLLVNLCLSLCQLLFYSIRYPVRFPFTLAVTLAAFPFVHQAFLSNFLCPCKLVPSPVDIPQPCQLPRNSQHFPSSPLPHSFHPCQPSL